MKTYDIQFEDGAIPEPHEIQTALFLIKHGKKTVKFLAPKNQNRIKTPDILMDGKKWEIKSPTSNGSRVMEHALRSATKQSPNVIIDLRRGKMADERALRQITFTAKKRTALKRLIVLTKDDKMLDIK